MTSTSTQTTTHTSVKLSKQRILMERVQFPEPADDELIIFAATDESPARSTSLIHQDWVDMGSPDVVTVTVEPGDHLNEEG